MADAQSADAYFLPAPGAEGARSRLGWLGKMTEEACQLELLHHTPGPLVIRDNVRKQLGLDHARATEMRRGTLQGEKVPHAARTRVREARPPLLRLWQITTGRPAEVLDGYGMQRAEGWPPGFWLSPRLYAMGVVVLRELPRERDTLLLRLLGRGRVLHDAIKDFDALPEGAPERELAFEPLIAFHFKVEHDPHPDREAREFLMATQETFEQWKSSLQLRSKAEGKAEGLVEGLLQTHVERFGPLSQSLERALRPLVTTQTIAAWIMLFATASAPQIQAAIRRGKPTR